jgi:hypothetical protein
MPKAEYERDVITTDHHVRPFSDMRETGLLWYINRTLFHPRGYTLGFMYEEGELTGWCISGDGSEPYVFEEHNEQGYTEKELMAKVKELFR